MFNAGADIEIHVSFADLCIWPYGEGEQTVQEKSVKTFFTNLPVAHLLGLTPAVKQACPSCSGVMLGQKNGIGTWHVPLLLNSFSPHPDSLPAFILP